MCSKNTSHIYAEVNDDPSKEIKKKNDKLVQDMCGRGEISEKIAEFLVMGDAKLPTFHHLLKTHKIPLEVENPSSWLESHRYPIRGIISCKGGPTERLATRSFSATRDEEFSKFYSRYKTHT